MKYPRYEHPMVTWAFATFAKRRCGNEPREVTLARMGASKEEIIEYHRQRELRKLEKLERKRIREEKRHAARS